MALNAAGLDVSGEKNPRWMGGLLLKTCENCATEYTVKRSSAKSRFCSLKCVGVSQRGRTKSAAPRLVQKSCETCGQAYSVPTSHAHRHRNCSRACSYQWRSRQTGGAANPNWTGGLSRLPYPWDFRAISRRIIERDGGVCRNPGCAGTDPRLTTHHINYDKQDCADENLIALCSACNSKANFGREHWQAFYSQLNIGVQSVKGAWKLEEF